MDKQQYSIEVGGRTLTFEISRLAEQANAAVLVKYGETAVLTTVVMSGRDEKGIDYLPLKVDYEERFYAAGKIIGSRFIRREGRPSEEAILAGRLVDRTIRPLFDHALRREIQVVVTVLAIDEENDPEFLGLMGASMALAISDVPWNGPVGGVRVARLGGECKVNPLDSEIKKPECVFETFAAGPAGKINMIELGGLEAKEEDVIAALELAQKEIDKLVDFQKQVAAKIGKPKSNPARAEVKAEVKAAILEAIGGRLEDAVYQPDKISQQEKLSSLKADAAKALEAKSAELGPVDPGAVAAVLDEAVDALVHKNVMERDRRPDGRKLDELRALQGDVAFLPRTHGSALFVRGNTQALAVTTLAAPGAEQLIETMETTGKRRFMLHYNFPHFSVGETGRMGSPGRREIGHGNLARKALERLIPAQEEFPYIIRVVSEILSSNGSSSMATVCSSTLSMMDAGVPLKKMAAGIAMGLMTDGKNYKVLTDIQGPEDHYGDMDFKVAGTEAGVNALQMDTKVDGVPVSVLSGGLAQAKKARLEILAFMKTVLAAPRASLSPLVPSIVTLVIDPSKIGMVIGSGGKTINGLIEKYKLETIDIEDDGHVYIAGKDKVAVAAVSDYIKSLTREVKVGDIVEGNIVKIMDFGAIVDIGGGQDGMIHVSELKDGYVKQVTDVVHLGDFVRAKVIRAEDGRIGLSLKQM